MGINNIKDASTLSPDSHLQKNGVLVSNGINTGIRYLRPLTYGCGALVYAEGGSRSAAIIRARRSTVMARHELSSCSLPSPILILRDLTNRPSTVLEKGFPPGG